MSLRFKLVEQSESHRRFAPGLPPNLPVWWDTSGKRGNICDDCYFEARMHQNLQLFVRCFVCFYLSSFSQIYFANLTQLFCNTLRVKVKTRSSWHFNALQWISSKTAALDQSKARSISAFVIIEPTAVLVWVAQYGKRVNFDQLYSLGLVSNPFLPVHSWCMETGAWSEKTFWKAMQNLGYTGVNSNHSFLDTTYRCLQCYDDYQG